MSANHHKHEHGHAEGHEDYGFEVPHSSFKGYVTGFILSVILTAIPFWLVMAKVFDKPSTTALVCVFFGAVQIVVHMIYFLHMSTKSEGGWSMLALIFTVVVVVITLSGSIWVMYHMNANMMPTMSPADMKNMP